MSDSDGFVVTLCKNDNFACFIPWSFAFCIIIPTLIVAIASFNIYEKQCLVKLAQIELESKKEENSKFKSLNEKERLISILKDKSVLEIEYLLKK